MSRDNITWCKPTKAHGIRWEGFFMSKERSDISCRRQAKCAYCDEIFLNGKPNILFKHIKDACKKIPIDKKTTYLMACVKYAPSSSSLTMESPAIAPEPKQMKLDASNYFTLVSKEKTNQLYQLLLTALITGNVPFCFLENPYFEEYQRQLACSGYTLPTRKHLINTTLPILHAKYELSILEELQNEERLTLSLDGWSDKSENNIYALMVLRGCRVKRFVDVLNLHEKIHTAENIFIAIKNSLQQKGIPFEKLCSFVSDSPSIMTKLQELVTLELPHIVGISCCLHTFNLIAKDILSHSSITNIVSNNKLLVQYFSITRFWREHLETWRKENNVCHGLHSACETRWYSMAKVCLCVEANEQGFLKCVMMDDNATLDTPPIKERVRRIIRDRDHFIGNTMVVKLLCSVVDAIGRLECSSTNLSDIWKELAYVHQAIKNVEVYQRYEPFKEHCVDTLHRHSIIFTNDIYIAAFFLNPCFRRVAVSRKHSTDDISIMLAKLALKWKLFSRVEALFFKSNVNRYYNNESPFNVQNGDPLEYWMSIPITPETFALKKIAICLLEIVPHATGVEGLFSMMAATKTKTRNQMSQNTLQMVSQVKLHLSHDDHKQEINLKRKQIAENDTSEFDIMSSYDSFWEVEELQEFEEGVFRNIDLNVSRTREEVWWMDTIFDFDMAEISISNNRNKNQGAIGDANDEEWGLEDLQ